MRNPYRAWRERRIAAMDAALDAQVRGSEFKQQRRKQRFTKVAALAPSQLAWLRENVTSFADAERRALAAKATPSGQSQGIPLGSNPEDTP